MANGNDIEFLRSKLTVEGLPAVWSNDDLLPETDRARLRYLDRLITTEKQSISDSRDAEEKRPRVLIDLF